MRPLLFFICSLLLANPARAQTNPPEPPAGFTWQALPEIKASFLCPAGWFFKNEQPKGTSAYFITRERIENGGQFQTGLSLNAIREIKSKGPKLPARSYAEAMVMTIAKQQKDVLHFAQDSTGPLHLYTLRYRSPGPIRNATIVHNLLIANTATDTFYFIIFESPEPEWEAAWQKGEVMLRQFSLDPEV